MSMVRLALLLSVLWILSPHARADGGSCPPGYYPIGGQGTSGCAPLPNQSQGQQQVQSQSFPSPAKWVSHFGALAADAPHGVLGTATGMASEAQAGQLAMSSCIAKGGTQCKGIYWYSNGCVTLAVDQGGGFVVRAGTTQEDADKASLDACKSDGAQSCEVYYRGCSPALPAS